MSQSGICVGFKLYDEAIVGLPASSTKLLLVMIRYAHDDGVVMLSKRALAIAAGIGRNTMRSALKELVRVGVVQEETNVLRLHMDLLRTEPAGAVSTDFPMTNCWRCGTKVENAQLIEVHHLDRDRNNNAAANLVRLCCNCHALDTRGVVRLDRVLPDWAISKPRAGVAQ